MRVKEMTKSLMNTRLLFFFYIRRERLSLVIWILALAGTTAAVAISFEELYATEAEIEALKHIISNPAITAMVGPAFGLDHYTLGAMMSHQMLLFTILAVAIMNIVMTAKHTRADEETGRMEQVEALPLGRLASLFALFLLLLLANGLIALTTALALIGLGLDGTGSFLYGAVLGLGGLFFASLTALGAQVFRSSRTVLAFSFAVLIWAYIQRAAGDMEAEILSYTSPLGLLLYTEVYVNNYLWPLGIIFVLCLILFSLAFFLKARRDLGSSLIGERAGKARGGKMFQTPFRFIFRLQFGLIFAWLLGIYLLAASYASMLGELEYFLENLSFIEDMLPKAGEGTLLEQFLVMLMSVMSLLCLIPGILILLRLYKEEEDNRMEPLLTTGVSRGRILGTYISLSVMTSIVMLLITVLGFYSVSSFVTEEKIALVSFLKLALGYLPAILVMLGLTTLIIGGFPGLRGLLWLYLAYSFIVIYLGDLLDFPEVLDYLTPFGYVLSFPLEGRGIVESIVLLALSLSLFLLGLGFYRRRDLR